MAALAGLPLGGLRFFDSLGSTNDEALAWAAGGASDSSLVIADEQTAGRGRSGRKWSTPAGTAVALSVILRPAAAEGQLAGRLTGLGALAVVQACQKLGLTATIKWPNDVLLDRRKVAGILVESVWAGSVLEASIVGIGVNVARSAVPPADQLAYPATSLEQELGRPQKQVDVLRSILSPLLAWRSRLSTPEFMQAWEQALAFQGETVIIGREHESPLTGTLLGLEPDGSLRLMVQDQATTVHVGEIRLRPMDDRIG